MQEFLLLFLNFSINLLGFFISLDHGIILRGKAASKNQIRYDDR
jgi:hypothetical protein